MDFKLTAVDTKPQARRARNRVATHPKPITPRVPIKLVAPRLARARMWDEKNTQDSDDWWEDRLEAHSLEEADRMADDYRDLANRLRRAMEEFEEP